jgi:hypothetical protein
MGPAEYREAWAWVHQMLRGSPELRRVLLTYLHELRSSAEPPALRPRLQAAQAALDEALARHLAQVDLAAERPVATSR